MEFRVRKTSASILRNYEKKRKRKDKKIKSIQKKEIIIIAVIYKRGNKRQG